MASIYHALKAKKFDILENFTHYILYRKRGKGIKRKKMEEKSVKNTQRIVCGGAVGVANSLLGGGGGMIAVPMLQRTGLQEKEAHATAILLILPVSLLSFVFYAWKGLYDFSVLIPTSLGVTAGGVLGAQLLGKLPVKSVNLIFAVLQFAAGIFMFFFK